MYKYKLISFHFLENIPPPLSLSPTFCTQIWETGVVSPLESPRALTDDLPSFSLSPLPYITEVRRATECTLCHVHVYIYIYRCVYVLQIGDYLLTLPQQLEPFTSQESPALITALKHGHLPFPPTDGTSTLHRVASIVGGLYVLYLLQQ